MRERTLWRGGAAAPLRAFLRTESGSSGVLVAAIAAALIWSNISNSSYDAVWHTDFSIRLGGVGVTRDLQTWINSGLMTLFFLVVGLEARREIDLGDLRDRRRVLLPMAAGVCGLVIPILIYLAVNRGGPAAHGWGVAMSTDTALALGLLALIGRRAPGRLRAFLLTVFVVDDLVALGVIAIAYTKHVEVVPLIIAIGTFGLLLVAQWLRVRRAIVYAVLGVTIWGALLASGVDPVVAGLAIGLTASAYSPVRADLEQASVLVRLFREQPTPELARSARQGLILTLSPNARLQRVYHPWTSYVIVPLFGLANAGIALSGGFLAHAYTAPITLGVLFGYVLGKPIGVIGASWLVTHLSRGRIRPPVGWAAVTACGTIAGIGFTVSLLIADLAFEGQELSEAKVGVLSAALVASILTWTVYRVTALMPTRRRVRALLGAAEQLVDLSAPVDPERDHIRGPEEASVTVVEYGDFECPYCGQAEPAVRNLVEGADIRYVWRHLPLTDVHPQAHLAAEASEAAAAQGAFWELHDLLLSRQDNLMLDDLMSYAEQLGLDQERFRDDLLSHRYAARVDQDVQSADISGVSGTPTFFINGQRHYGAYDIQTLTKAIRIARARSLIRKPRIH